MTMFSTTTALTHAPLFLLSMPPVKSLQLYPPTNPPINTFPDTGASICLSGSHHLNQLKLMTSYCVMRLKKLQELYFFAANGHQSKLSLAHIPPLNLFTPVTKLHFYFSKKDCLDTHILPPQFPLPKDIPLSTATAASLSPPSTSSPPTMQSASTHCSTCVLPVVL